MCKPVFKKYYLPLVLKTPCKQSLYGSKIVDIDFGAGWQRSKNQNRLIKEIVTGLKVNGIFELFGSTRENSRKISLNQSLLGCTSPCLFICADNGILESLFFCIRNALAHGDIVFRNGFYEFFSVKKENAGQDELDGKIIFFLRVRSLNDLNGFLKINKYFY